MDGWFGRQASRKANEYFVMVRVVGCMISIFCFIGNVMSEFPEGDINLHSH